ncbi:MAG: hypothetical protein WAU45_12960 [Blastocatellia bacterium]
MANTERSVQVRRLSVLASGRAITRRFPYAIYFSVEDEVIVFAVLHTARDPAEWQRRIE